MSAAKAGCPLNHPAGNFCTRVTGRLCGEIIGVVMEDYNFPDDIFHPKAVSQKRGYRKAVIPKQWRQVARMVGVPAIFWVVMRHGMGERFISAAPAVGSLVNMEPENPFLAGLAGLRKSTNFSINNYSFVGLVKPHPTGYAGKALAAGDAGLGLRPAAQRGKKMDIGQIHVQRSFTKMLYMASYAEKGQSAR